MTSNPVNYLDFKQQLGKLTPEAQCVLQVLALSEREFAPGSLAQLLNDSGCRTGSGHSFKNVDVSTALDKLKKQRWITWGGSRAVINRNYLEPATRFALEQKDSDRMVKTIRSQFPINGKYWGYDSFALVRELRWSMHTNDADAYFENIEKLDEMGYLGFEAFSELAGDILLMPPFELDRIVAMKAAFQEEACYQLAVLVFTSMSGTNELRQLLSYYEDKDLEPSLASRVFHTRAMLSWLQLDWQSLLELSKLNEDDEPWIAVRKQTLQGAILFLKGEHEQAIAAFETALKFYKSATGKRAIFLPDAEAVFFPLACLIAQGPASYATIEQYVKHALKRPLTCNFAHEMVALLIKIQQNQIREAEFHLNTEVSSYETKEAFNAIFHVNLLRYLESKQISKHIPALKEKFASARQSGLRWYAFEYAALLTELEPKNTTYKNYCDSIRKELDVQPIFSAIQIEPAWRRALNALELFADKSTVTEIAAGETRLVWLLNIKTRDLQPKEQKQMKNGRWTTGRDVALKRLKSGELTCITPHDRKIIDTLKVERFYYGNDHFYFDFQAALSVLVGHPLLFNHELVPIELMQQEPQLHIREQGKELVLELQPSFQQTGIVISEETPTRYNVTTITEKHLELKRILGNDALVIPATERKQVAEVIPRLAGNVAVHAELEGYGEQYEKVPADARIHCHLLPRGDGFRVDFFVRPFGEDGPYFKPGKAGKTIIHERKNQKLQTSRDLHTETENAESVLSHCQSLEEDGALYYEWHLDDPQDCLQTLLDLRELGDEVVVAWPEGEKLRLSRQLSFDNLSLKIKEKQDWFSLSGTVQVDDTLVLKIQELLGYLDSSPGQFIKLGENQFLALTEAFRKKLEELRSFTHVSMSDVRIHPTAAIALQDFTELVENLETDRAWQERKERMAKALSAKIELPSTFRGELRGYQREGFVWMSRLAQWGMGACLADDMGLGKTIQALALILSHTKDGPTLVVAPSSVQYNWVVEANRFAPTLNVHVLGDSEREQTVKSLKAFDVLLSSYGLLIQEAELLQSITWEVIVLDEAQAIKNTETKRSKAAMALKGNFRLITTGTPIENHIGELWNLFNFLNPGLLGSLKQFNERFAGPIVRDKNPAARHHLKKLVQPFILRRLKTAVLEELPPKTEITLTVEMSAEERALYETLRLKAVSDLENSEATAGERYVRILAAITRLRRACCNPSLVLRDKKVESAKLKLFVETVRELRESNHKALVFSQFVDHLTIIRKAVEEEGWSYQYLDGRTPIKERQRSVDAFQAGNGELFLISLRAGGFGLNLTAADYVIHMDPWWNPAVEDQASDRTHRIGQQQPVTIYRMVTKDTIEERIVQLHQTKRDLADSLLAEGETSAKMSAEELMQLIRGK